MISINNNDNDCSVK